MKNGFTFLALCLLSFLSYSQNVNGYIRDSLSGENLIGAYIYSGNYGVVTNEYGYFVIDTKHIINNTIEISFIGYTTKIISVNSCDKAAPLIIKLNPNMILPKIIIEAPLYKNPNIGETSMTHQTFKYLPKIGGETNIIRAIHLLPGVNAGSEGTSNFHVRGGSSDQNLILLDDIPIYYINHLGGFISVFDAEIISSFNFYKGTSPAKYGGRLSSVLDIRTKDGNMRQTLCNGTIGLLSSRFSIEGPVKIDTSSYVISVRRSLFELFTLPYFAITKSDMKFRYSFYDIHFKYNKIVTPKGRLYINFFRGFDTFSSILEQERANQINESISKKKWGNTLASFRYNYSTNTHMFLNFSGYFSEYSYNNLNRRTIEYRDITSEYILDYYNTIRDFGGNTDFHYSRKKFESQTGGQIIHHTYIPNKIIDIQRGVLNYDSIFNNTNTSSFEAIVFTDNSINFRTNDFVKFGLRASQFTIAKTTFFVLEPRLSSVITIFPRTKLHGFYGINHQNVHFLQAPTMEEFGADSWIPANKFAHPEKSILTSLSISHVIPKYGLDVSLELYHKKMNNVIEYKEHINYFSNLKKNWEDYIEIDGIGISQGIEIMVRKNLGRINGWFSYTLAESTRQFQKLNNGNPYIYSFDSKHSGSIVINYLIAKNIVFSCTWIYYSGRAYTINNELFEVILIQGSETSETSMIQIEKASEKNNVKMAAYHRLDLNLMYTIEKQKSKRVWNFSIYNAYNRQNAYTYHYKIEDVLDENNRPTGKTKKQLYQYCLFPLIPSVSYGFYF